MCSFCMTIELCVFTLLYSLWIRRQDLTRLSSGSARTSSSRFKWSTTNSDEFHRIIRLHRLNCIACITADTDSSRYWCKILKVKNTEMRKKLQHTSKVYASKLTAFVNCMVCALQNVSNSYRYLCFKRELCNSFAVGKQSVSCKK